MDNVIKNLAKKTLVWLWVFLAFSISWQANAACTVDSITTPLANDYIWWSNYLITINTSANDTCSNWWNNIKAQYIYDSDDDWDFSDEWQWQDIDTISPANNGWVYTISWDTTVRPDWDNTRYKLRAFWEWSSDWEAYLWWDLDINWASTLGIDNTDPSVTSSLTKDSDSDWIIDQIVVTIDDWVDWSGMSTCETAGWSVTDNDWLVTAISVDSCTVDSITQLTLDITPTTGSDFYSDNTPALSYTAGLNNNEDLAWNELASYWAIDSTDWAAPSVISASTIDDWDGTVDQISITLSENVADVDLVSTDFTVSNGCTTVDSLTLWAADDDALILDVSGCTADDTSITPTVTITAWNVPDSWVNTLLADYDFVGTTDGAAPVLLSATAVNDTTVELQYSETVTPTFTTPADWDSTWITSIAASSNADDTIIDLTVNSIWDTSFTSVDLSLTINDDASDQIVDWNTNKAVNIAWFSISDWQTATITLSETWDSDWNGQIDNIEVTFSEDLDFSTFTNDDASWFSVAWYTVNEICSDDTCTDDNITDDVDWNIVYISLTESWASDTDAVPVVSYTAWTVADISWNTMDADSWAATDKSKPTVTSVSYSNDPADAGSITLTVVFSESVGNVNAWVDAEDPVIVVNAQGSTWDEACTLSDDTTVWTIHECTYTVQNHNGTTYSDGSAYVWISWAEDSLNEMDSVTTGDEAFSFTIQTVTIETTAVSADDTSREIDENVLITGTSSANSWVVKDIRLLITKQSDASTCTIELDTTETADWILNTDVSESLSYTLDLDDSVTTCNEWWAINAFILANDDYKLSLVWQDSVADNWEEVDGDNSVIITVSADSDDITNPTITHDWSNWWSTDVSVSQTSADLTIETDENTTVVVYYWTTNAYWNQTAPSTYNTATPADATLASLSCGTTYHYYISATDGSDNNSVTLDAEFTTSACTPWDTTAPTITYTAIDNQFTESTVPASIAFTLADDTAVTTLSLQDWSATNDVFASIAGGIYTLALDNTVWLQEYVLTAWDAAWNEYSVTVTYQVEADWTDITAPVIESSIATVLLDDITLSVETDENATCAYSENADDKYTDMTAFNTTTWVTTHSTEISNKNDWTYVYYIRCSDGTNAMTSSSTLVAYVSDDDTTAPDQEVSFENVWDTSFDVNVSADDSFDVKVEVYTDSALSVDAGVNWDWVYKNATSTDVQTVSIIWASETTLYYVKVIVSDLANWAWNTRTKVYTVTTEATPTDTTAPVLVSSSPVNAATYVSVADWNVSITFDENITIVDETIITIEKASDSTSVRWALANWALWSTILDIPYTGLDYNTSYKATVSAWAISDWTNLISSDIVIYFTTQSASAPIIDSLSISDVTNSSATISYELDLDNSLSKVSYKISTTPYAWSWVAWVNTWANWSVDLSWLNANTTYYYQLYFIDSGEVTESIPMSFTTARWANGIYVDQISTVKSTAKYDSSDPWTNGWHFRFSVTSDDDDENQLQMYFDNWISGTNILTTSGNMKMLVSENISTYDEAAIDAWTDLSTSYGTPVDISGYDNNTNEWGNQFYVDVFVKVPSGQASGSYSTTYWIKNSDNATISFDVGWVNESSTNNATKTITVAWDTFANVWSNLVENTDYTIAWLPAWITASITVDTANTSIVTLSGTADTPLTADSTVSVTLKAVALDWSVDTESASFDIIDEAWEFSFDTSSVNESATNTAAFTVTLIKDNFANTSTTLTDTTDYTIAWLPVWVTAALVTSSASSATLTFTWTPTTPLTADATVTLTILANALNGSADTAWVDLTISDEVVAMSSDVTTVADADANPTFVLTLTKDQLTAWSDGVSIWAALSFDWDLAWLVINTVTKTSVNQFTVTTTWAVAYNNWSWNIILNNSELEDSDDATVSITVTAL